MTIQQVLFIALSLVILGAALFVVTTRNLFRAALLMMVSFFGVAGFYVLLDAGFFAVAQVLVYIGAISILIIFGVMLTRGMQDMIPRNSQAVAGAIVCAIVFAAIVLLLGPLRTTIDAARWPIVSLIFRNATPREVGGIQWTPPDQVIAAVPPTYIQQLGFALVDINQYALPFELASVTILLVMIGAIWVARERRPAEVIEDRAEAAAEEAAERAEMERALQPEAQPVPEGAMASNVIPQGRSAGEH